MKTLILLFTAFMGMSGYPSFSQPQTIANLFDSDFVGDIIDINGTVYFSGSAYLQRMSADHTGVEMIDALYGKGVNFRELNGILYFTMYREGYNYEASLWRSDGTPAATRYPVKTFTNTFNTISPLASIGNTLYFGFQDQLYQSDGTSAGTVLLKDLGTDSDDGFLRLAEMDGKIFISFRKSAGQYDLWVTDGTASGTNFIRSFRYLEWLRAAGSNIYFIGDDGTTGNELWKLAQDGTTTIVRDLNAGGGSLTPGMTLTAERNNELIFTSTAPSATWKTSGTAGNTAQIAPFAAGELAVTSDAIMLIRQNELWKSDGNILERVSVFSDEIGGRPLANLTAHGRTVFFTVNGLQLWETDGTADGTVLITEHKTRAASSRLIAAGQYLYQFVSFSYVSGTYYQENAALVKYDPSSVWIPALYLVDADADTDIRLLSDNDVISVDQNISLRAEASSATASIRFSVNGRSVRRETKRPFALAGDNSGDYNPWPAAPGVYNITATPYSAEGFPGSHCRIPSPLRGVVPPE
jgi:ELWxxDGT repeat protein